MSDTDPPFDPKDETAYPVWSEDEVRFADLDLVGHVNNNAIGIYFETARLELFDAAGLFPEGYGKGGVGSVIVHLAIDFIEEIGWPNTVRIGSRVTKVGNTSFTYKQGIFVNGTCRAVSHSVQVMFDMNSREKMALTAEQKARLLELAEAPV